MIREIVKPKNQDFVIHLPDEYLNQELEILVFPINTKKEKNSSITSNLSGILKNSKIDEEDYKKHLEKKYL
jgi:hypothetical protein